MILCPIWQCGGTMIQRETKYSKKDTEYYGDVINWQIPELACENCHAIYRCVKFNDQRIAEPIKESALQ